jgi:hypothetical protein
MAKNGSLLKARFVDCTPPHTHTHTLTHTHTHTHTHTLLNILALSCLRICVFTVRCGKLKTTMGEDTVAGGQLDVVIATLVITILTIKGVGGCRAQL